MNKLAFADWLTANPQYKNQTPDAQKRAYDAYSADFDAKNVTPLIDKAKSATSPQAILGGVFGKPASAQPTTAVKPIDFGAIDRGEDAGSTNDLVNNRVTWGSANKNAFMDEWRKSNQAVREFSEEAKRADPQAYAAAVRKNEILNSAANKLRYSMEPVENSFADQVKNAVNILDRPIDKPVEAKQPAVEPLPQADRTVQPPPKRTPIVSEPPSIDESIPPEVLDKELPKGIDWSKVGEMAKQTGVDILSILQAAIAGRTAGLQNRALDFDAETLAGMNRSERLEKEKEQRIADLDEKAFGRSSDLQMKLALINQQFTAEQNQLQRDFDSDMAAAKSEDDRQKVKEEYAQRLKELQIAGAQRLQEIQAQKASSRTQPALTDTLGIR